MRGRGRGFRGFRGGRGRGRGIMDRDRDGAFRNRYDGGGDNKKAERESGDPYNPHDQYVGQIIRPKVRSVRPPR